MKIILNSCLVLATVTLFCHSASADTNNDVDQEVAILLSQLDQELEKGLNVVAKLSEMIARDQFARKTIINIFKDPNMSSPVRQKFQKAGGGADR